MVSPMTAEGCLIPSTEVNVSEMFGFLRPKTPDQLPRPGQRGTRDVILRYGVYLRLANYLKIAIPPPIGLECDMGKIAENKKKSKKYKGKRETPPKTYHTTFCEEANYVDGPDEWDVKKKQVSLTSMCSNNQCLETPLKRHFYVLCKDWRSFFVRWTPYKKKSESSAHASESS